jgi:hypothetical protein
MAIDPYKFKQRHPMLYAKYKNQIMRQIRIAGIVIGRTLGFLCGYYPQTPAQLSLEAKLGSGGGDGHRTGC